MRGPGSTVLRMVANAMNVMNIEIETGWTPEEITELALEEGFHASAGRFQRVAKPTPMGIVRTSARPTIDTGAVRADDASAEPSTAPAPVSQDREEVEVPTTTPTAVPSGAAVGGEATAAPDTSVHLAEHVIAAARATGVPELLATAGVLQASIESLARQLLNHVDRAEALADVARLEAELAEARERAGLGTATPSPARPIPGPDPRPGGGSQPQTTHGATQSQLREWAHSVGMEVNPRGSVCREVREAYAAAHQGAAA